MRRLLAISTVTALLIVLAPAVKAHALCVSNCTPAPQAPCVGDGSSGYRVLLWYGIIQGQPDHSSTVIPAIIAAANEVNQAYRQDGNQNVRWACNPSTGKQVVNVVAMPDNSLATVKAALQGMGFTSSSRIYSVVEEAAGPSGLVGQSDKIGNGDDRAYPNNTNATGPFYDVTWGGAHSNTLIHESAHSMGAVQNSAPFSTGAGHVHLQNDLMGYNDGGPWFQHGGTMTPCRKSNYPPTQLTAPSLAQTWDCTGDDYYNPAPAAGSYLSTHWNLFNSVYLSLN